MRDALRLSGYGEFAADLMRAVDVGVSVEERIRDRIAAPERHSDWRPAYTEPLLALAVRGDLEASRKMAALHAFGAEIADPALFPDYGDLRAQSRGREAEMAFEAIALLTRGDQISAEALHGALSRLIAVGLIDEAKMIAVEAVLIFE